MTGQHLQERALTEREAMRLCSPGPQRVTLKRNHGQWTGCIKALVQRPCVVFETDDGKMVAVVIDGTTVKEAEGV